MDPHDEPDDDRYSASKPFISQKCSRIHTKRAGKKPSLIELLIPLMQWRLKETLSTKPAGMASESALLLWKHSVSEKVFYFLNFLLKILFWLLEKYQLKKGSHKPFIFWLLHSQKCSKPHNERKEVPQATICNAKFVSQSTRWPDQIIWKNRARGWHRQPASLTHLCLPIQTHRTPWGCYCVLWGPPRARTSPNFQVEIEVLGLL